MNAIARLFWLPFNNRVVDDAVVPGLAKSLGSFVRARGFPHLHLSDDLLDELLAEAIVRARAGVSGEKPRYRELWLRIDEIADEVARIYRTGEDRDPAVAAILRRHDTTI